MLALLPSASEAQGATSQTALGVDPSVQLHVKVSLSQLPLPPTVTSRAAGACTTAVNSHDTGCISGVGSPGFFWDPTIVLDGVNYAGAPAAPSPGSVYTGNQIIAIKTNGTTFPGGDAWKCITCGIPVANIAPGVQVASYPPARALPGDRSAMVGNGILTCGRYVLTSSQCTPAKEHIYPIDLDGQPLGGTIGGAQTREWRLNPDGVHLGWNALEETNGDYDEFAFVGRLSWDGADLRYNLTHITMLYNGSPQYQPYVVKSGNRLVFNPAGMIGEWRGWSADGKAALGIQSYQSDSVDAWATSLATGRSRPLTNHAEYTDPMFAAPNRKWMVNEEVLGSGRMDFISGMQGIPPITDQLPTTGYVSGIRNANQRRFFQPFLVSTANRDSQQVNAGGDPNWNALADPVWLADSSAIVYEQAMVTPPNCGGTFPNPCPTSTEPGGRTTRLMIARFPTLRKSTPRPPKPISDRVPWGTPYHVGQSFPARPHLPAGTYTQRGRAKGLASVVITTTSSNTLIMGIQVTYKNFSDNPKFVINGIESAQRTSPSVFSSVTWHENLTETGAHKGTKTTSANGLTLSPLVLEDNFQARGTMTTAIDGQSYTQPANGQ
jgi:hypothetical protein